ncbi:unnamed protein product [Tuber melanosporum]|uniref:(Perigord truffle) hypothetical protein n=1 Tax=Tuber melanosporum (strain Mel28) TaxID=656061 RepID=D5G628_TUBMM|nr:uncharacterized protein GSTUM_00001744001 [Tuber melanosporum]CAZ79971.1 unnamed protein product [Tuber melanosporum]
MAPALDTMTPSDAVVASENQKSVKVLDELLQKLSVSKTKADATYAAENLATFINGPIEEHEVPTKILNLIKKQLANKKDALAREHALTAIAAICLKQVSPKCRRCCFPEDCWHDQPQRCQGCSSCHLSLNHQGSEMA